MAIAIRQNLNIKGIPIGQKELKISQFADDSTFFLNGSPNSFTHLFDTLKKFSDSSGCKINLSKLEALWIGASKGSLCFPFSDKGLSWNMDRFITLGINFSLNLKSMFDLNYKVKLKQMEGTLNCWRSRNLSIIGKACVIKSLLLPQLLFLFSVVCIKIPKSFFDQLNHCQPRVNPIHRHLCSAGKVQQAGCCAL